MDYPKTIVIESKFHNTEAMLRPRMDGTISDRQMARARAICCGMGDCHCPVTIATPGWDIVEIDAPPWEGGHRLIVDEEL